MENESTWWLRTLCTNCAVVHNSGSNRTPVCRATASAQVFTAARKSLPFTSPTTLMARCVGVRGRDQNAAGTAGAAVEAPLHARDARFPRILAAVAVGI